MEKIVALLLDERDVLRAVETLEDASQLTARHIDMRPHGNACDRKPGEYRWDRARCALQPLPRAKRATQGRPSMEMAYAFDLLERNAADPKCLPEVTLVWLDDMVRSVDFGVYWAAPIVQDYAAARGLKKGA